MTAIVLPPGWTVLPSNEIVPNPNEMGPLLPGGGPFFSRKTFIAYDNQGQWVAASGSEADCYAQALSVAQARSQQYPYGNIA